MAVDAEIEENWSAKIQLIWKCECQEACHWLSWPAWSDCLCICIHKQIGRWVILLSLATDRLNEVDGNYDAKLHSMSSQQVWL